jgi:hypothetical protein
MQCDEFMDYLLGDLPQENERQNIVDEMSGFFDEIDKHNGNESTVWFDANSFDSALHDVLQYFIDKYKLDIKD